MSDQLITLPNANLRQRSTKITLIDKKTKALIKDMEHATLDWEDGREHEIGVALAGVQIGALKRVIVIRNNLEDKKDRTFRIFINPEIIKLEGAVEEDYEGCLSVKDVYGKVPRYTKVRVKALDASGQVIRVKAEGFLARVFQHEIDHTNGKLFIDHIKNKSEAFYTLVNSGKLEPLDYEKDIKDNKDLWPDIQ